jgi:hypothetical protein
MQCETTSECATMFGASSRGAFLLEDDRNVRPIGGTIRLVPLALIARIVPAADEETGR